MRHPHIPRTWSGPEALAIADMLHALVDAIFDVYYPETRVELLAREFERDASELAAQRSAPAPVDDLAPF